MKAESEKERLSQQETLEHLLREIDPTDMVRVYHSAHNGEGHYGIYCALIPADRTERVLSSSQWDLRHGAGMPTALGKYADEEGGAQYLRFGSEDGIEPLVIDRMFFGVKEDYVEVSEEFRLFHNLYHDRKQNRYIKIDDSGNEDVIAIVKPRSVDIRLKEIRQFLAVKEMYLSIQFDCMVFSSKSLAEMGLAQGGSDERDGLAYWNLSYSVPLGNPGKRSFSVLQGKRLIGPFPKVKSGFEGFAAERANQYSDFIIGMDDNGDDRFYTCDPNLLSNYFGANPDAPHYVTPVNFRKQVLDKYYREPSKYKIDDGVLSCGALWHIRIDNHHDDKVCAMLGDLGTLSYQEQLHWRSYNFASSSRISEVTWRRDFLLEWTESDRPEHAFQERYRKLSEVCQENLGWQIFLPLAHGDEHHIQGIRVPATDEQQDFDSLILGLATILVDSLNLSDLKRLTPESRSTLSIQTLENVLKSCDTGGYGEHIDFLRGIQSLRSSGAAHRKGQNYTKAAANFGANSQNLRTVFANILWQAVDLLDYLITIVESQKLSALS